MRRPHAVAGRVRVLGLASLLCGLGLPVTAAAQELDLHVEVDSSRVLVGMALVSDMGTVSDPAGYSGLTSVATEAIRLALAEDPAIVSAEVTLTRGRLEFTVLARPEDWPAAARRLRSVVLEDGPPARTFDAARAASLQRFRFTAATPLREVDLEAARLFTTFESDWSRPIEGTLSTVESLTQSDFARLSRVWANGRWAGALTGPVEELQARAVFGVLSDSTASRPVSVSFEPAWTQADRIRIAREVTSTWIVAAFPLPADLTPTRSDHLLHRVDELLNPVTPDPGLFDARVERVRLPQGIVLRVTASVLPEAASRWEERIRDLPGRIEPPADPDFFRWERRRFRAHLLLADAASDRRALRMAQDLLVLGSVRDLQEEAWALEPDDLADAAQRLSPPRILVFGPDLGGDGPGARQ